jgi:hypothetical protein
VFDCRPDTDSLTLYAEHRIVVSDDDACDIDTSYFISLNDNSTYLNGVEAFIASIIIVFAIICLVLFFIFIHISRTASIPRAG